MPHLGLTCDEVLLTHLCCVLGQGPGLMGSWPPGLLRVPESPSRLVRANPDTPQTRVPWTLLRSSRRELVLSSLLPGPSHLHSCWGPPWPRAHQRVKCFPRSPQGSLRPPPAECIKKEAFLPGSSARATRVRPWITLQHRQEASH